MSKVKYPDVQVKLTGTDANIYFLLGRVTAALRRAGHSDAADQLANDLFETGSYDEALALLQATVTVL